MDDRLRVIERRNVDELIILDVAATSSNHAPRFADIRRYSANLYCPLTVGGGVRTLDDIRQLLANGADKVAISTMATESPTLITRAAQKFGSQAVVGCIESGPFHNVHCWRTREQTEVPAVAWARELEDRGAGEIVLTSIERDGMMNGYDLDLIHEVSNAVSIPVVACGGCGKSDDALMAIRAGAHAVAIGAMFQFCDITPKDVARHLVANGIAARVS